jgi:hypothetical protein
MERSVNARSIISICLSGAVACTHHGSRLAPVASAPKVPTDDFAHVNFDYLPRVARLNGATVGALAAAPAMPDSVAAVRDAASGGQRWRLTWAPVPRAVRIDFHVSEAALEPR